MDVYLKLSDTTLASIMKDLSDNESETLYMVI